MTPGGLTLVLSVPIVTRRQVREERDVCKLAVERLMAAQAAAGARASDLADALQQVCTALLMRVWHACAPCVWVVHPNQACASRVWVTRVDQACGVPLAAGLLLLGMA